MSLPNATVHVVDDDEAFRESVGWLLESAGLTCRLYDSGAEFLRAADHRTVGCLVTDLRMPGMSGLELQSAMNREHSTLPVIMMTAHGDVDTAVRAMKSGALEFIQKPFKEQDFLDMVNAAIGLSHRLVAEKHALVAARDKLAALSAREREVLDLIVDGNTNKATAAVLKVSEKTVEAHRASIMQKLELKSLAELMKFVLSAQAD
jgi:FixJ family two-component response regulator